MYTVDPLAPLDAVTVPAAFDDAEFSFMIRLRVDRAKEMLAEGGRSIAEVASHTGFGSPIQLTRAFRRVLGTTPSAFRRDML